MEGNCFHKEQYFVHQGGHVSIESELTGNSRAYLGRIKALCGIVET
ncbi:MAG: hypothetical protein SPK50_07825 [Mobiluncus porci]|nr:MULTISPECIES: hypothetical protein [Mobiluncus]MCI6583840.1 hypothetical protein [Mobiluncus sp.]MDD7541630.1 hypothetical protein [Mobiluncus porci]MDY5749019.1 hypothetical protein [Mobiluncus porci]